MTLPASRQSRILVHRKTSPSTSNLGLRPEVPQTSRKANFGMHNYTPIHRNRGNRATNQSLVAPSESVQRCQVRHITSQQSRRTKVFEHKSSQCVKRVACHWLSLPPTHGQAELSAPPPYHFKTPTISKPLPFQSPYHFKAPTNSKRCVIYTANRCDAFRNGIQWFCTMGAKSWWRRI
ncbi:hypothetical protein AAMO2058_001033000 [Amorphochlora amoebiformis]